ARDLGRHRRQRQPRLRHGRHGEARPGAGRRRRLHLPDRPGRQPGRRLALRPRRGGDPPEERALGGAGAAPPARAAGPGGRRPLDHAGRSAAPHPPDGQAPRARRPHHRPHRPEPLATRAAGAGAAPRGRRGRGPRPPGEQPPGRRAAHAGRPRDRAAGRGADLQRRRPGPLRRSGRCPPGRKRPAGAGRRRLPPGPVDRPGLALRHRPLRGRQEEAAMNFLAPERLALLILVAVLALLYAWIQRRRRHAAVRFTNVALLAAVAPPRPGWRRHLPAAAVALALIALVVSIAEPVHTVRVPKDAATIMLVIDVSASMDATDVAPTRLEAAVAAGKSFVDDLPPQIKIGLISFSRTAQVIASPTVDHQAVRDDIDRLILGT